MKMKITKGLTWPFLLLSLASTLVFMAGLAALQRECYSLNGWPAAQSAAGGVASPITNNPAVFGVSDGGTCRRVLRFYWFTFAFVIITLLGIAVTAAISTGLHFSRPFWAGMVTICILLMMIASEAFLGFTDMYEGMGMGSQWINCIRTVTAGAIMSVAFLVFLLMALGVDWEHRAGYTSRADTDKPVSGVVPTTAAVPVQNVRVVDQV